MKKVTIFIIVLAAIVGIVGLYYYQKNIYSKDTLKVEILGPEEVELLEEVEYIIKYKNNGDTRLDEPELIFEYPENALPIGETSLRITKGSDEFGGSIYPGQEQTFTFKARLLGKENQALTAKAAISYRPKNLNARYDSKTTLTTVIEKVPLTFEFDLPSEIESAKESKFKLNYFSNVNYPISDLRIIVEYPSDFEFIESSPISLEKTEWEIGLLNKAEGGRIEISGRIFGEVGDQKVFQAKIGTWQDGEFILLKEVSKGVVLTKPSLYISQTINGNPKYIASPGDILHYEVFFKNLGEGLLNNLSLITKLEGEAFDLESLRAPYGTFEQGDDSIIFDWRRVPKLQFLAAGQEGEVEFWVELKDEWPILGSESKNPLIKNNIYLSQAREEFINKVNSKLVINQKGYFQDEVFGNSGPIPPKVGEITTYTIMWQVKNFYNDVNNVKVKATLPKNIELTGQIFPETAAEKFAFDSQSREIVWEVGDLKVSQGVSGTSAPNISFQIKFRPTTDQKGKTPNIIGQAKITGQDQWTNNTIEATSPSINTALPDDETVDEEKGTVQ